MAFSFEPFLAISAGHIMAVSAGPEQDYAHPDDSYYDYRDDFWDYEDAEDYREKHH